MIGLRQCLRPSFRAVRPPSAAVAASYLRLYSVAAAAVEAEVESNEQSREKKLSTMQKRNTSLLALKQDLYPRCESNYDAQGIEKKSCEAFLELAHTVPAGQTLNNQEFRVYGRVKSIRFSGPRLIFIDLVQEQWTLQIVCNLGKVSGTGVDGQASQEPLHLLRKGDVCTVIGYPHRTERGSPSLMATRLPQLQSPCLHEFPYGVEDQQTRMRNRHVDLQVNRHAVELLRLRSDVVTRLRQLLGEKGYTEVQTPIMANAAGGAIARPFETTATEFAERRIQLRTAPELWLKRLVLGGLEKVFEIGPCFRNEGIDRNHNPEFTTCEFYGAYHNLEALIEITEGIFTELVDFTNDLIKDRYSSLPVCKIDTSRPFSRLNFIKDIETAMDLQFPDLSSASAEARVLELFRRLDIPLPPSPTLPRLLDRLSAKYLEPLCKSPTWITGHPECLAPLSKSYFDPLSKQRVSARAELFIEGQEVVNTYEEENSPHEQRRKFTEQLKYRDKENSLEIDVDYLKALEWGLPPTGGWGCGIDRLVMLLSGADRIADVLPFGTLRNVVALGNIGQR